VLKNEKGEHASYQFTNKDFGQRASNIFELIIKYFKLRKIPLLARSCCWASRKKSRSSLWAGLRDEKAVSNTFPAFLEPLDGEEQ
jgi:hypothetical protein